MDKSFEEKVEEALRNFAIKYSHSFASASSGIDREVAFRDTKTALLALVREEVEKCLPQDKAPSSYDSYDIGYYNAVQGIRQSIAERMGK